MSHDKVAMRVVTFLGAAGIIGLCGVIFLVWHATGYDKIDPSTVALVAGVSTIVGALFGSLGSILASTGKGNPAQEPTPVEVVNTKADPVPTEPTTPLVSEFE